MRAALLRYGVPQISAMGYCPNGSLVCRRKMQRLGAECASDAVSSWSSVNLTSSLWIHHQRPSGWALEAASRPIPWGRCVLCRRKMQRLGRNLLRFRRSVILVICEAPRAHCGYTIIIRVDGLWRPHLAPSRGEGVLLEAPIALHVLEVFSLIVIRVQV